MLLMSCQNLSRGYGATPLFDVVAFELHADNQVGFLAPNGAGNATVLSEHSLAMGITDWGAGFPHGKLT